MKSFEHFSNTSFSIVSSHFARYWHEWVITLLAVISFSLAGYLLIRAPIGFPEGETIVIKQGEALPAIARELYADDLIEHPVLFQVLMRITGHGDATKAGPYHFAARENLITIAARLARGKSGIPDIRITMREGESVRQMSAQVAVAFPEISASNFIATAGPYEGYLFPDTYRFSANTSASQIVAALRQNFFAKIASITPSIASSTHSLSDIVIMASIVQAEASDPTDQKLVAGALWNRINKGMPLQVDATFGYIADRAEYAPSLADLSVDSPYNTYKHTGLPPGPIGNPGLTALMAAAYPAKTNYLYYLTGSNGRMYYATTYAGHLANERAYLK